MHNYAVSVGTPPCMQHSTGTCCSDCMHRRYQSVRRHPDCMQCNIGRYATMHACTAWVHAAQTACICSSGRYAAIQTVCMRCISTQSLLTTCMRCIGTQSLLTTRLTVLSDELKKVASQMRAVGYYLVMRGPNESGGVACSRLPPPPGPCRSPPLTPFRPAASP